MYNFLNNPRKDAGLCKTTRVSVVDRLPIDRETIWEQESIIEFGTYLNFVIYA